MNKNWSMSALQMLCFRIGQEISGARLSVCIAHVSNAGALWMGPQTQMTLLSFLQTSTRMYTLAFFWFTYSWICPGDDVVQQLFPYLRVSSAISLTLTIT